jgi:hypothetical protein
MEDAREEEKALWLQLSAIVLYWQSPIANSGKDAHAGR